jgi:hypothetical protein
MPVLAKAVLPTDRATEIRHLPVREAGLLTGGFGYGVKVGTECYQDNLNLNDHLEGSRRRR